MKMFTLYMTHEDLNNLGYPPEIRKDMYLAYYNWVKEDKPMLEFKYEREVTEDEYYAFMEKTKWLKG